MRRGSAYAQLAIAAMLRCQYSWRIDKVVATTKLVLSVMQGQLGVISGGLDQPFIDRARQRLRLVVMEPVAGILDDLRL